MCPNWILIVYYVRKKMEPSTKKKTATCRIATSLKSPQHSDEISITTALKPASSKPMWTQLVYRTVPFMLFNESKSIRPSALEARGGSFTHMKAYWRGTQCKCNDGLTLRRFKHYQRLWLAS